MKTILAAFFSMIVLNCVAKDNLQYFSKAIFITLVSTKQDDFIVKDTTITIPDGKVWKITYFQLFMTHRYAGKVIDDQAFLHIDWISRY